MSNGILIKFGNRVREERLRRDFSQEKLAMKVGLHRTYISIIERGEQSVTLLNMEKIAKALGVNICDLLK